MDFQNKCLEEFIILGQRPKSPYQRIPAKLKSTWRLKKTSKAN
jgi:hypothetical protein